MALTRRQFLKWAGATGVGAVVFNGCSVPDEEIRVQSSLELPEDLVTGRDNFYATVQAGSSGGEGLLVRVMEGRAKKVEGNPDYPVNTGKHGVRAEALLQALYHPDRIKSPMARIATGPDARSERVPFRKIGSDEAVAKLVSILQESDPSSVLIATGPTRGELAGVLNAFSHAYGSSLTSFESIDQEVLRACIKHVFGQDSLPDFDFARTGFLLNFGSDFLGTWISPTHFSRGYGEFRQGNRERGHFVQVDSRFSMTTAASDEWLYIEPGTEGQLAMSLAYVIIRDGLGDPDASRALTSGRGARYLQGFNPEKVSETTGIPAEKIEKLAHAFADKKNGPALAIGGGQAAAYTNGLFNMKAIYSLNHLVGSVNRPGGIIFNPNTHFSQVDPSTLRDWKSTIKDMRDGKIRTLLVKDANILYGLPKSLDVATALNKVENIVSFSSFLDEVAAIADLVIPGHTPLEEWGSDTPDVGPGYSTVGFQQPVVRPQHDTLGFGDVILRVASEIGLSDSLPWPNMREALRSSARTLHGTGRGSVQLPTFEEFWKRTLERGGWWNTNDTVSGGADHILPLPMANQNAEFSGSDKDYPFVLIPFESQGIGTGQMAHLPWLQSTPDPITTVAWETWVELNPGTAKALGIRQEDVVLIDSPTGASLRAVAYVNPAAPPHIIGVPFGQGHTQFTSYAANRGVNILNILEPAEEKETGSFAWASTRVRLTKTRNRQAIPKLEGTELAVQLPDMKLIEVVEHHKH